MEDVEIRDFLIFDGAMGTMLQQRGLKTGELPEIYNITHSKTIIDIHTEYVNAGSHVVTTNTFGANALKLNGSGYSVQEVIKKAVENAKAAKPKYVALDIGPIGQLIESLGTLSFDEAYNLFAEQVKAGAEAGVDLILIETMSDLYEAKAAVLAAKENCDLPVICTMSFQKDGRTFTGTDALTATLVLNGLGVDAVGANCSLGPEDLMDVVNTMLEYSKVPVAVQANAGIPREEKGRTVFDVDAESFADSVSKMAGMGVKIIGGCCGTTPEYIKLINKGLKNIKPKEPVVKTVTAVCSGSRTHILGGKITVIGERINPTGKKRLQEALRSHQIDYILGEAVDQLNAGADILDVNVGLPEIDEAEMIKTVVKQVQSVVPLPLQIDSSDERAIEGAVRYYNGRPIINSVNGKREVMDKIFPIAKKYGALVIGLTLDEKGIPKTALERFEIAKRILDTAIFYGIPKEDILIDCLVLTASAQQQQVMETLNAIKMVKSQLGLKTVLGVSNVSFGLPNRPLINSVFLAAALSAGLDAPIINPLSSEIMQVVDTYRVLSGEDENAALYIEKYSNAENPKPAPKTTEKTLKDCILEGLKEEAVQKVKALLETNDPIEIVDSHFIPALDIVGGRYEKGEIFLPQLIRSAQVVQSAFEVIRQSQSKSADRTKGKIVLATVEGDIHDIGKNIVKLMLENYGFEVIDLGKDVKIQRVVDAVLTSGAKLVGLSALMTTTVKNMKDTISALRQAGADCKVMVGGAVLNENYAKMVGADYYAKDAQAGVRIAVKFFNGKND
ncbi:MAG TPA: dihydropteroate synthase [Clostridiales bacterium]|nr:dihydropteroate synthase [Clostridiales bacterium]